MPATGGLSTPVNGSWSHVHVDWPDAHKRMHIMTTALRTNVAIFQQLQLISSCTVVIS